MIKSTYEDRYNIWHFIRTYIYSVYIPIEKCLFPYKCMGRYYILSSNL